MNGRIVLSSIESTAAFLPVILMKSEGKTRRRPAQRTVARTMDEKSMSLPTSNPSNLMTERRTTSGASFEARRKPELDWRKDELERKSDRRRREVGIG